MKKVESIINFDEYMRKNKGPIGDEVTKAINESAPEVQKLSKTITKEWYKILMIVLASLGILFIIIGILIFTQSFFKAGIILLGIGIGSLMVAFIMKFNKNRIMLKIQKIYVSHMDKDLIFKTAINNLPGFELKSFSDIRSKYLNLYTYKIPSDANIVSNSDLFETLFKNKYKVLFQIATYHWQRTTTDKDGNTTTHDYYKDSGFIIMDTPIEDKDHSFVMKMGKFMRGLKKIELENDKFVSETKFRSNDEIKSRMMFTPLAMEEIVNNEKIGRKSHWTLEKSGNKAIFRFDPIPKQFIINASKAKTNAQTIQSFMDDISTDFYNIYKIVSVLTIPPFF